VTTGASGSSRSARSAPTIDLSFLEIGPAERSAGLFFCPFYRLLQLKPFSDSRQYGAYFAAKKPLFRLLILVPSIYRSIFVGDFKGLPAEAGFSESHFAIEARLRRG
jgi:hypothetical protein